MSDQLSIVNRQCRWTRRIRPSIVNWGGFLGTYLRPFAPRLTLMLTLLLSSIGMQVYAPQLMRRFLDQAQAGAVLSVLVGTAVLFLIITVAQKLIYLVSVYLSADLGGRTTNQLRLDLTNHVLRLDMGFHKLTPAGELIERVEGDINNLAEYFSDLIIGVFANLLLATAIILLLFREDWRFGVLGVVYGVAIFTLLQLLQKRIVSYWTSVRGAFTALFSFLEERLGGLEDIQANGGRAPVMYRLHQFNRGTFEARVKAETTSQFAFVSGYMLYALALIGGLWISVGLFRQGGLTAGGIILIITYLGLLEKPFDAIRREIETFQRALASIGRIQKLFAIEPKILDEGTAVLPISAPTVQFDEVSFGYNDSLFGEQLAVNSEQSTVNSQQSTESDSQFTIHNSERPSVVLAIQNDLRSSSQFPNPLVLKSLSFTLEKNRTLGVLGRTGSGKTTLTRLLFRLYDVDDGAITFDGVNIAHVALSDLRQFVGLVTQDVQLFEATIRDNLTLFRNYTNDKPPISDAQIIEALHLLGLQSWLEGLEDGLDTRLQTGGKGLSAGEAQLVALTRVFLRDPKLVILDEASSRLDPATEQLLERAMDRLLQNRTGIIIAHRLGTVQRANDILILENGRIAEHGDRLLLANNPDSRFAQLLQTGLEAVMA